MRKFNVVLILGCIMMNTTVSFAQNRMGALRNGVKSDIMRIFTDGGKTVRPMVGQPKVDGHPFIKDVWSKGKVYFTNGFVKDVERLNYDALEQMLIMFENGIEFEFTHPVKSFYLYDDNTIQLFWNINAAYYEVLYEGEQSLLKKHKKAILTQSKYSTAWADGLIISEDELFILDTQFKMNKIKKGGNIFKIFNNNQVQLKSFAKAEKLNLRSEKDLKRLFQYNESLL